MTNNGHPNNVANDADRLGLGMIASKDFFGEVNEALSSFARSVDMLRQTLPIIIKVVVSNGCPNKRVSYLAFYARKKRARKKNLKRALKEIRHEHIRNIREDEDNDRT